MRAAVEAVEQAEGAVGVLINNAGYSQSGAIETVPLEAVRRQFETNVFGLVRSPSSCCRRCARSAGARSSTSARWAGGCRSPARPLPRDQARARGDLRRAALRAARLRHRRDPARAGPDHDRVRRGGDASMAQNRRHGRPRRGSLRAVQRHRRRDHQGRLRRPDALLGGGPDRVAKVIERALTRRRRARRASRSRPRPSS